MSKIGGLVTFAVGLGLGACAATVVVAKQAGKVKAELTSEKDKAIIEGIRDLVNATVNDIHDFVNDTKTNIGEFVEKSKKAMEVNAETSGETDWDLEDDSAIIDESSENSCCESVDESHFELFEEEAVDTADGSAEDDTAEDDNAEDDNAEAFEADESTDETK